jgi:myosin heavy subunit
MANVVADLGDKCTCKIADKEKCTEAKFLRPFDLDKNLIMDYSPMADKGLQDMIDIDELNHATILWNLYKRYIADDIYTYVGPTLLAVNPFKRMDHKYPPA